MSPACPVCGDRRLEHRWHVARVPFRGCRRCGAVFAAGDFDADFWTAYYNDDYHRERGHGEEDPGIAVAKRRSFARFLSHLPAPATRGASRLLEVGCGTGDAVGAALDLGFDATGVDVSAQAVDRARRRFPDGDFRAARLEEVDLPPGSFDAACLFDMIEHVPEPHPFAARLADLLVPGGRLLVVTPNVASLSARCLGPHWFHTFPEHVLLHTPLSLAILFETHSLRVIRRRFAWKHVTPEMLMRHAELFGHIFGGGLISGLRKLLPPGLRGLAFPFNVGEMLVLFEKKG
ncbi:MAG: class I SAM-dependent methyltransferase [Candidatus Lernaella stagnicola]|nr:class I SAM-dependent methyltransferase [Candidatus Lernaella stagnicola]